MVRLTADVFAHAVPRLNCCQERELDLRGLKIPAIENVGVTQDQFDVLDFTDNEIKRVDNFPKFTRLSTLLLSNNHVTRLSPTLHEQLPNLDCLILTNNKMANLSEVDHLVECTKLTMLSFVGNPIARRQHYRLYVIAKLPQLKSLDFSKVKAKEREEAARLFRSAAGRLMQQDVEAESKTFTPGEDIPSSNPMANLTAEQKEQVRAVIAAAETPEEVDRIERQLKAGIVPTLKKPAAAKANGAADADEDMDMEADPTPTTAEADEAAKKAAAHAVMFGSGGIGGPPATSGNAAAAAPAPAPAPTPPPPAPAAAAAAPPPAPAAAAEETPEVEMEEEPAAPSENGEAKEGGAEEQEAAGAEAEEQPQEEEEEEEEETLTAADVAKMKVAELKEELTKRGLETKGLKKDLAARLTAALK